MTYDLRQGLTALGDAERAAAPALPVGALLTRAHRKRMAHAATYSAIGVGAAAAVTIGAIAANGTLTDRDPVPPATEAPTSTPTQTPPATPTTTPTTPTEVAWAPNWGLCGMPAEDFWARGTGYVEGRSQELYLSSDLLPESALPMGEPLTLQMRVLSWGLPQQDADVRIADVVALDGDPFTGEGQVVAVAAVPTDIVTHGTLADGDGMPLDPAQVTLTACTASPLTGGDGALDAALPHGSYQAGAVAEVTTTDGIEVLVGWLGYLGEPPEVEGPPSGIPSDDWLRQNVTPEPLSLTVPRRLSTQETWNHNFEAGYSYGHTEAEIRATCLAPAAPWPSWPPGFPDAPSEHGTAPAGTPEPVTVSATGFRDGTELVIRFTTTNVGPPASDVWLVAPGVIVAKDDRIIGWASDWNIPYESPTLATGQSVSLDLSLGASTCTFMMGEPWPAGSYEVYVQQNVDIPAQAGYEEPWRYDVLGGPFTFTLD